MKTCDATCPKCGSKNAEIGESEDEPNEAYLLCHDCKYQTVES